MNTLGQRMKHYRKLKGWNQTEVAAQLEATQQQYSEYEKDAKEPRNDRLCEIARVLGVSPYLLTSDEGLHYAQELNAYLRRAVTGNYKAFASFWETMLTDEKYPSFGTCIRASFSTWGEKIQKQLPEMYERHLKDVTIKHTESIARAQHMQALAIEEHAVDDSWEIPMDAQWKHRLDAWYRFCFCEAVYRLFEENTLDELLRLVADTYGMEQGDEGLSDYQKTQALQRFALEIFGMFVVVMNDALENLASYGDFTEASFADACCNA